MRTMRVTQCSVKLFSHNTVGKHVLTSCSKVGIFSYLNATEKRILLQPVGINADLTAVLYLGADIPLEKPTAHQT